MSHIIKYAVLRYSPSIIAGEAINLGVLVSDEESDRHEFHHTKQWARVEKFDDELNIPGIKQTMVDIKKDVENTMFSLYRQFSIDNYTRDFVNELHFSKPLQIECEKVDTQIDEIKKIYLRFDFDKRNRLSETKERNFVKSLFAGNGIEYKQHEKTIGDFGVPINYDFVFNNYGVKFIRFENKDIAKMLTFLKAWAWDCEHDHSTKPIIIYSPDNTNTQNKNLMDISLHLLKDATENVYSIDDAKIGDILSTFNRKDATYPLLS